MAEGRNIAKEIEAARILREQISDLAKSDDAVIADTLEGEIDFDGIVTFLIDGIDQDEAFAKAIKEYAADISARAARYAKSAGIKRALLASAVEISGRDKIVSPAGTVSLKRVPPSLIITEEADVPAKFFTPQAPKLDRAAILEALKAGDEIIGAMLSNGSTTIQIRK